MGGMEKDWVRSYYEGLEFFYEEPQHLKASIDVRSELKTLDKLAHKVTKRQQVAAHLGKMEVTLNQNIRQLFLLAPKSLRKALFKKTFGAEFEQDFVLHGSDVDKEFGLNNCTQPDFLFTSETAVVSIEMKVSAKCTADQIVKYAVLGLAVELKAQPIKHDLEHNLILLAKAPLSRSFNKNIDSIDAVHKTVAEQDLKKFLCGKPLTFRKQSVRFEEIVSQMRLAFVSYDMLAHFLRGTAPPKNDESAGAEVYRNLIDGIVGELHTRQLLLDSGN